MSLQFLLKLVITVAVVLVASAVAKRSGWLGALVASLPLTWLYTDTRYTRQVADLSMNILWFVLGSLPFFVVLTLTLRHGGNIELAFATAAVTGFAGVSLVQWLLTRSAT